MPMEEDSPVHATVIEQTNDLPPVTTHQSPPMHEAAGVAHLVDGTITINDSAS